MIGQQIKPVLSGAEDAVRRVVEGTADWILDLGPGGGVRGGEVVAEGVPEDIACNERSYTGQYLKPLLERAAGNEPVLSKARA